MIDDDTYYNRMNRPYSPYMNLKQEKEERKGKWKDEGKKQEKKG